ncbi:MAG: glycerol kinase [Chloroflexi bacterium]|nr:MAG: glycerol kinase [Chloroflexota bacterium]MBL1196515.1 glycerol kinase [Chloroflexota bacterium]NOH13811.1 glycerol kinase GlpK [Chloroflexota bacterium]
MPDFVGAIDQGTTSTRFMIFDHDGAIVTSAQKEHEQIYPQPGWVEHDPIEIWQRTQEVIHEALDTANLQSVDLAAIGITNQRETTVVWDKQTGEPLYNALVWQDTRTDKIIEKLAVEHGQDRFRGKVGLPLATYFSGPKLVWLLEHVEGLRAKAEQGDALFGTVDTWLSWKLTGGLHVTDVSNASRTMLMNLKQLTWDKAILDEMSIPKEMLPEIQASSSASAFGVTQADGPFGGEVPITGILGDQHAALFGQTCFTPGDGKNTYGTGCFMLLNTGEEIVQSENGLLTTMAYQLEGQPAVYALEGSIAITGALVQWLRDNLGLIKNSVDVETLARTVEDNGGVYFVPAFSGLYAPYWRSDARGVIAGLTRYANKGHLGRAVLEATAFQTREVVEAMQEDSGVPLAEMKVDGGMVGNELLMQFQADILNVPVVRPVVSETTALGAAYAAGLAVGFWDGLDDLKANWKMDTTWQPYMDGTQRQRLYAQWKKTVTRSFDWVEA